jgi:hypothetical protein
MSSREVELAWLVSKVQRDAEFIERLREYYNSNSPRWSAGMEAAFRDYIERKTDQYLYEYSRMEKLGFLIASGREHIKLDI